MRCSELSAGEPLAGTATTATSFLLLEHRGPWGRDAVENTDLREPARSVAGGFAGRVMLIRRPDRRGGDEVAFRADAAPEGGALHRVGLTDDAVNERVPGPFLLVCVHGRRDRCCARLGVPVYDALAPYVDDERLWQSSHHGGHRFAANVLVLPHGVQLGRVRPEDAVDVAACVAGGRIPLAFYRGRTIDSPRGQAADVEVRRALGLDRIEDVRPLRDDGHVVEVAAREAVVRVDIEETEGPSLPASCGAEPEPVQRFVARIVAMP
jgi:hypothetical protein